MQELTPFNHFEEGPLAAFDRVIARLQLPKNERKVETFRFEFTDHEKNTEDVFNVAVLSYRPDILKAWDDQGACELSLDIVSRMDAHRVFLQVYSFLSSTFLNELVRRVVAVEGQVWQLRAYRDVFFLHDGKNIMMMFWLKSHVDVVIDGNPLSNQTSYPH